MIINPWVDPWVPEIHDARTLADLDIAVSSWSRVLGCVDRIRRDEPVLEWLVAIAALARARNMELIDLITWKTEARDEWVVQDA